MPHIGGTIKGESGPSSDDACKNGRGARRSALNQGQGKFLISFSFPLLPLASLFLPFLPVCAFGKPFGGLP
jgi:hypothetical protein